MALAGSIAGGIAGLIGNPAELMMVRMQADKAKPPESESGGAVRCGAVSFDEGADDCGRLVPRLSEWSTQGVYGSSPLSGTRE